MAWLGDHSKARCVVRFRLRGKRQNAKDGRTSLHSGGKAAMACLCATRWAT
jgi:hypothetical protein